jgi:ethanolamine ammonia-lyase small subunit
LARFTRARIALGRAGGSWRTQTLLDFRLAHAQARDAVAREFAVEALEAQIRQAGYETARLSTGAGTRAAFLKRPDLGQILSEESRRFLREKAAFFGARYLVVIVSDGLSALAAEMQTVPLLAALLPPLHRAGWKTGPVLIVPFGRVKLQDQIGELLGARQSVMLLGERPGLGSPDSLGAYLTWQPSADKTDADRNCVSNIRSQGLPPTAAGARLAQLLLQSARQGVSGVKLKEVCAPDLPQTFGSPPNSLPARGE